MFQTRPFLLQYCIKSGQSIAVVLSFPSADDHILGIRKNGRHILEFKILTAVTKKLNPAAHQTNPN